MYACANVHTHMYACTHARTHTHNHSKLSITSLFNIISDQNDYTHLLFSIYYSAVHTFNFTLLIQNIFHSHFKQQNIVTLKATPPSISSAH